MWQPMTEEELNVQTQLDLNMADGSPDVLAFKCAVLAHRLTKYEGTPDKQHDNGGSDAGRAGHRFVRGWCAALRSGAYTYAGRTIEGRQEMINLSPRISREATKYHE